MGIGLQLAKQASKINKVIGIYNKNKPKIKIKNKLPNKNL